jgi:protocatechuate 3,4-dioxygenase beta subunit
MRPIALIVLLVAVALALVGGLMLLGRSPAGTDPAPPSAADGASRAAETPAPDAPAGPALDATGSDASDAGRAESRLASGTAAPAAAAAAAPAPGVVLRGRVLGTLGKPVEGATVLAAEANGFVELPLDEIEVDRMDWFHRVEARTDRDGRFEIRPQARSKVTLAVRAPGFAPLDRQFALSASERDVGDLLLDASVVLSGRVVDSAGRAVEGAKIARVSGGSDGFGPFARARGALVATTDAQGVFRVDQLAVGAWTLLATHEKHPDLVERGETDRPGTVQSGLVLTMADGVEIQGRLVGAPAGAAAKVTIRATLAPAGDEGGGLETMRTSSASSVREARCAADGSFALAGLLPGRAYRLTARDTERARSFFGRARSAPTPAKAGDLGVEIAYRPESALVFQAVDAETGAPIVELSVRAGWGFSMPLLDEDGRAVKRFPEGRVRFGDLPGRPPASPGGAGAPGLELTVESPGYRSLEKTDVAVLEGQDTDLGVLRLERAPVVRVLVLDGASGAPVEGASVSIAEESDGPGLFGHGGERRFAIRVEDGDDDDGFLPGAAQRARTGADGRASLTSLPGKTVRLRVRHEGHSTHEGEAQTLPAAEDLELTVRLGVGGQVRVEVVDAHEVAVSGVEIDHQGPDQETGELLLSNADGTTDADGVQLFDHLPPGDHRFRLRQSQSGGLVALGGPGARMRRMTTRLGGGGDDAGWTTATVVEGQSTTVRLVAPSRGSLAGRVTEGGRPLASAQLRLVPAGSDAIAMPFGQEGRETRTDGRGEYLFDGVEEGEYRLEIQHSTRAMTHEAEARVREGETKLDVDLPVAIVEGRVTAKDGKPIAGVRVRAERAPAEGETRRRSIGFAVMITDDGGDEPEITMGASGGGTPATTDAEGRYTLRGVVPDVDLVVHATGKEVQPAKSEPFKVAPDGVKKNVDLSLEDGGAIEISVRRAGNGAPGRFLARATPSEGGEPKIQMIGPGGATRISGLKPGRWHVVLDPLMGPAEGGGEGQKLEQDVEVVVGQSAKASFESP